MKMDPRDTVKLRASLVTRRGTKMYSGTRYTGGRGEIGGGDEDGGRKEREREMEGGRDEREAIEAKRELNVEE